MNDTKRFDWLEQNPGVILNHIPKGSGMNGPQGQEYHVGVIKDPLDSTKNRHYWGFSMREVLDHAIMNEGSSAKAN